LKHSDDVLKNYQSTLKNSNIQKIIAKVGQAIQDERDGKNKPMVSYGKLIWTLSD
jgi:hypothetical protein